jgi:hypothetical protein
MNVVVKEARRPKAPSKPIAVERTCSQARTRTHSGCQIRILNISRNGSQTFGKLSPTFGRNSSKVAALLACHHQTNGKPPLQAKTTTVMFAIKSLAAPHCVLLLR